MSLLKWFSGKSDAANADALMNKNSSATARSNSSPLSPDGHDALLTAKYSPVAMPPSSERKTKRHARREQLYLAVREAFTHSGVLSSTYKFKVLSLDQSGNEFMVMVDIAQTFDHQAEKLSSIEQKVVRTAKNTYDIHVTSVYWHISTTAIVPSKPSPPLATPSSAAPLGAVPSASAARPSVSAALAASALPKKPVSSRYEPIEEDELAAFKKALTTASASRQVPSDASTKPHKSPRSYALLTGFEDTEMPDSPNTPTLSATQYGELN